MTVYTMKETQNVRLSGVAVWRAATYTGKNCISQGVKCIFLVEPGKWVQSFFLGSFKLYRYCTP